MATIQGLQLCNQKAEPRAMHVSRAGQLHYRMTALVSGGVLPSLFFLRASLAWSRFGMGVVFPILHPRDVSPSPSLPLSLSLSLSLSRARSWAWEASEASRAEGPLLSLSLPWLSPL